MVFHMHLLTKSAFHNDAGEGSGAQNLSLHATA